VAQDCGVRRIDPIEALASIKGIHGIDIELSFAIHSEPVVSVVTSLCPL